MTKYNHSPPSYKHIPIGPKWIILEFLIDTGAQISVLNKQQGDELGIKISRKPINIIGVKDEAERCTLAPTQFWLPGEKWVMAAKVVLSSDKENILGFDILLDKQWYLPDSRIWNFGSRGVEATFELYSLLLSKATCIPQYPQIEHHRSH